MQYDLNQLVDPKRFQRLVNAILIARFGEEARLTPIQGTDGGSDGETAPYNPYMEYHCIKTPPSSNNPLIEPPQPGRYLFQAKYHRTGEQRLSELRNQVVREFKDELQNAVLERPDRSDLNYFFVVTNVTASEASLAKVNTICIDLLKNRRHLHADIWWGERITASLDWSPDLWMAFPELFPGGVAPYILQASKPPNQGLSRTLRLAISKQHQRDLKVKFRQIELEQNLLDLFVDVDGQLRVDPETFYHRPMVPRRSPISREYSNTEAMLRRIERRHLADSALEYLIDDTLGLRRILLEGGPGQGKSTVTQMAAQIYREKLLGNDQSISRNPKWYELCRLRLPIRIELQGLAQWISDVPNGTVEGYIADLIGRDSGGVSVSVEDIHTYVEGGSVILLFDGLDEIGNDSLRDRVIDIIIDTSDRFENGLQVDLRVILTTRPPALSGRRDKLDGFARMILTPMNPRRIDDYVNRWLTAQISANEEQDRIRRTFSRRRWEPHVDALVRNPMQLSVLLQFINLKGEAFPDRRAELYRDYFQIVIDRDVEKSPELREHRDLVDGLHSFLGFRLHGVAEIDRGRRTLVRHDLINLAAMWLDQEGHPKALASKYFALGEERFGLIVAVSGEGDETTFGFEVQPIQEYFAASYISNRLAGGKAHEVFELLVNRSYWREVALFLAGLRRPNEKADLVGRAKIADRSVSEPWQKFGRDIILELLREGVLAQPRHVLEQAVDFVSEILDVEVLRSENTPNALLETLGHVGKAYDVDLLCDRVKSLVKDLWYSEDAHLLALVHSLASTILPKDEYKGLVLGYKGVSGEAQSTVRITCPYGVPDVLRELWSSQDYTANIPIHETARRLWRSTLESGLVVDLEYPEALHMALVVQFATDGAISKRRESNILCNQQGQPRAIWKLKFNLQAIRRVVVRSQAQSAGSMSGVRDDADGADNLTRFSGNAVDYRFLDPDVETCLRHLIDASDLLIASLTQDDRSGVGSVVRKYMEIIKTHMEDPGISGWIACRCGIALLQSTYRTHLFDLKDHIVDDFAESLAAFYSTQYRPVEPWHILRRYPLGMPAALRVERGASLVPLHQALGKIARDDPSIPSEMNLDWLAHTPLSNAVIRLLVESSRHDLSSLLKFIGERLVIGVPFGRPLQVQDTQRILKICRNTSDVRVLQGAGTVLMCASFSRIAKADLIVKLLRACPSTQFTSRVLDTNREVPGEEELRRREVELALSRDVARLVMKDSGRYPFNVVCQAVVFLGETESSDVRPLFDEHREFVEVAN